MATPTNALTCARVPRAAAVGALVLSLTGCDDRPVPPTTVVINTPPADSGQVVLLTVMVGVAFLALIAAGCFAWGWAQERRSHRDTQRARREAEDALLAVTGQPVERVRLELLRQPLNDHRSLAEPRRPEIEGRRPR